MILSLIAAIGKNNELGKGNELLWHMPEDMKHFKNTTRLHTVVMGQKTFEALGKPLPNRRNIVLTRSDDFHAPDIEISKSLDDTLASLKNLDEEVFIIGGGEIYKQTIGQADKLYITHVDAVFQDADTYFPEIIPIVWNETSHIEHKKDDKHKYDYTFSIYEKFI